MYISKITLILLLISIMTGTNAWSQWKVVTENDAVTRTLFSIRHDGECKFRKGFYFPEFMFTDTLREDGYKLSFRHKVMKGMESRKNCMVWKHTWKEAIPCYFDSAYVYQRVYLKNVERYDILLYLDNDTWYKKSINITYEYYQIPTISKISGWEMYPSGDDKNFTHASVSDSSVKLHKIKEMAIVIRKKKASEKCEFVIGDFQIFHQKKIEKELVHPFFEDMKGLPVMRKVRYHSLSELPGLPVLLSAFPYYCHYGNLGGNYGGFKIVGTGKSFDELGALYQVVRHAIYKYPFFEVSDVQEDMVKSNVDRLVNCKDTALTDSLSGIIGLFHDPHFYLTRKKEAASSSAKKFQRPVQAVYLDGAFYIGAVFDTLLLKRVQPGMRIVSVDGIPIKHMVDSLSMKYKGTVEVRRNKALYQLFYKDESDSTRIGLCSDNNADTLTFTFDYKNPCIIPKNFTPEHMAFYHINPSTSYLRMNHWTKGDYIRFLNYYPELKDTRTLIIDLRNNPGGDETEVIRIASCFIHKPEIFNTPSYAIDDDHDLKETLVLYPNKTKNLGRLGIIFLVNERTACASEIFIRFIKARANGLVVGSSKTAGTYAYVYWLSFPGGTKLALNATCKPYTTDNQIIERAGIAPDIWVYLKEVKDFAPYDDKLLKTAIRLAQGYK